ncbi:hypothetical protein GH714_040508 [Hevea brasiliensis]|uniref:Uncharacterized protein n=1 Tax=Hevea brasiliensis TaxID=3981 RepID=A0A6A6L910_HEVBR|nr:hypothetical protein GH714_040508 [Hevea brasiliensis]
MPSSSHHTMQQERTSFEFIPTQHERTPFDAMFAPFSRPYTDVASTSRYGFNAAEASEMYFAPHDSVLGTFASGVRLFGHYESASMQNEAGPSLSMQQTGPELQLMSTQDVDEHEDQGEHRRHGRSNLFDFFSLFSRQFFPLNIETFPLKSSPLAINNEMGFCGYMDFFSAPLREVVVDPQIEPEPTVEDDYIDEETVSFQRWIK